MAAEGVEPEAAAAREVGEGKRAEDLSDYSPSTPSLHRSKIHCSSLLRAAMADREVKEDREAEEALAAQKERL